MQEQVTPIPPQVLAYVHGHMPVEIFADLCRDLGIDEQLLQRHLFRPDELSCSASFHDRCVCIITEMATVKLAKISAWEALHDLADLYYSALLHLPEGEKQVPSRGE